MREQQPHGSVPGAGTGAGRGPRSGSGPEPCACRWGHYVLFVFLFWAGGTNREVVFLQSHCSSQTERIIQPVLLTVSEVTAQDRARRIPQPAGTLGGGDEQILLFFFFTLQLTQVSMPVPCGSVEHKHV